MFTCFFNSGGRGIPNDSLQSVVGQLFEQNSHQTSVNCVVANNECGIKFVLKTTSASVCLANK